MSTPQFHRTRLEALAQRAKRLEREQQDARNLLARLETDAATTERLLRRAAIEARNVLSGAAISRLLGRHKSTVAKWIKTDLEHQG